MKRWMVRGGLIAAALGVLGFIVAASGIIPIKASSRHWAVTQWFLNFGKERSVATHSMRIETPPLLGAEWRILKGAGHFETGCRPCHGSPDVSQPRIAFAMTPSPPPLAERAGEWDAEELFYIVKHGIKFTGMPAWPAKGRDDEVWAMVAFLRKLPELDAEGYRKLVRGEAEPRDDAPLEELLPPKSIRNVVLQNCARCHGTDGNGRGNAAFPRIARQKEAYLYESMKAYGNGRRPSGIMEPIAAALDDATLRELARYYSGLPPEQGRDNGAGEAESSRSDTKESDAAAIARGERIALKGIPERLVPACAQCHGPAASRSNPAYPRLAGQYAEYLELQLDLFQARARGGGEFSHLMHYAAQRLSDDEKRAVARFYSALPAAPKPAEEP